MKEWLNGLNKLAIQNAKKYPSALIRRKLAKLFSSFFYVNDEALLFRLFN
jgi:hypothetical protein